MCAGVNGAGLSAGECAGVCTGEWCRCVCTGEYRRATPNHPLCSINI